jgi:hypothetical protein
VGSNPYEVKVFSLFSFNPSNRPVADSVTNKNEYQKIFLGGGGG